MLQPVLVSTSRVSDLKKSGKLEASKEVVNESPVTVDQLELKTNIQQTFDDTYLN